ncbi:cross-pathway control protein 1 [Venturia nashicola]|uniref:Cross-pathway control protein 1 n=1 Tax=Venturia nashicola TaxID=86259 RepID=A0A4Z1PIJ0_9PEZI|nr:cross-pathway control protein 1 [Venturia nashicola]
MDSSDPSASHHSTPLLNPSDPPHGDCLNSSTASRSFSSSNIPLPPATTALIQQSTWLPSPESHAHALPPTPSENQPFYPAPQADFVLFDQTPPRRQLAPPTLGHTFNTLNTVNGQNFYSNSAPGSTVNIRPQQTRPPVPLFNSNSTENIHSLSSQLPTMTGNSLSSTLSPNMSLTRFPDYNMSFDSLDANFGAGSDDYLFDSTVGFTAINTGASSAQTVSPKDIFSDGLGSAPPSTAFTNLTSPDINESPYIADSYECSPLFTDNAAITGDTTDWFSLFPDSTADKPSANPMERQPSGQTSSSGNSPLILDTSNYNRRKPSNPMSPAGHNRHSSVSGVKPRRRKGPLPPIAVDPEDKTALKRARNTLAARDSRQRKLDHVSSLENRIRELEEKESAFKETLAGLGYNGPLLQ